MSDRQWTFFVEDVIAAIETIQRYCSGMDYDDFREDKKTLDAVERNFILIGEAVRHIPPEIIEKYSSLPWREMRDMRNFAVHVYWGVRPEIIWDTIRNDLPALTPELRKILGSEGEQNRQ